MDSHNPGQPQTSSVLEAGLDLLIFLFHLPNTRDYRSVPKRMGENYLLMSLKGKDIKVNSWQFFLMTLPNNKIENLHFSRIFLL